MTHNNFPDDIDRDFYEHRQDGVDAVFEFHYAFREGVERVLEEDKKSGYMKTTRDGYFFAITRVLMKGGGGLEVDVTYNLAEFMPLDDIDQVEGFIEECLCGPPVPYPPEGWEGNWF